jgi:hypothetical protein
MNLSNQDVQLAQGMFVSSATQQHALGQRGYTQDGRVYRYAKAGAADLVAGHALQSPATTVGNLAKAINTTSATGVGATSIKVTAGSTTAVGFYNEGYAMIASNAGAGLVYYINNQAAISTGATGEIFFYVPEDALAVAVSAGSSTVSLFPSKYNGVVTFPTTATGVLVGVAAYVITAGQFGWIQTWGPAACLGDDTTAIGAMVYVPAGTTGRVIGADATVTTTILTKQYVGQLMQADVQAQWVGVDLRIAP